MAAGLVSHNITTASGVTFAVISWVPDTAAPDVGAVPVARITDGTSVAAVKAASTAPLTTDPAVVVTISPNSAIVSEAYQSSATFTPAAASHVAGDCNGAAQEFALIGPSAGAIMLTSASLYIDNTAAEASAWRLHLYTATPVSAIADDAPWDFADADVTLYLGSFDFPSTGTDSGANQWAQADGINKHIKLATASTSVFGYLVNVTTLTPAAAAHIVKLHSVLL